MPSTSPGRMRVGFPPFEARPSSARRGFRQQVAVYDGSMSEWFRDESLPMETGAS